MIKTNFADIVEPYLTIEAAEEYASQTDKHELQIEAFMLSHMMQTCGKMRVLNPSIISQVDLPDLLMP